MVGICPRGRSRKTPPRRLPVVRTDRNERYYCCDACGYLWMIDADNPDAIPIPVTSFTVSSAKAHG